MPMLLYGVEAWELRRNFREEGGCFKKKPEMTMLKRVNGMTRRSRERGDTEYGDLGSGEHHIESEASQVAPLWTHSTDG